MDIPGLIRSAKLGRTRKEAQVDCCAAFAAALHDVLAEHGVQCRLVTAVKRGITNGWAHSVVEVAGVYYDSMGEFSADVYRQRARIHQSVDVKISYTPDTRDGCYEAELDEMHAFYVTQLRAAIAADVRSGRRWPATSAGAERAGSALVVSSRRRVITKPDPITTSQGETCPHTT